MCLDIRVSRKTRYIVARGPAPNAKLGVYPEVAPTITCTTNSREENDGQRAGEVPETLYLAIQRDGQRLATGLIRLLHAMSVGVDLNPSDFQCYALLRIEGPMTPGEISQSMKLATGSVTVLIDRLEARGLVIRDRHPDDRRKVIVRLAEPSG